MKRVALAVVAACCLSIPVAGNVSAAAIPGDIASGPVASLNPRQRLEALGSNAAARRARIAAMAARSRTDALGAQVPAEVTGLCTQWSTEFPNTPALNRFEYQLIYDPVRDRLIVIAGLSDAELSDDVWVYNLSGTPTWTQLAPTGASPGALIGYSAIYDPLRDRVVVFGGYTGTDLINRIWTLSLASPAWTELLPAGPVPEPRTSPSAVYDALRDRMLVFGGIGNFGEKNDLWSLSLSGAPAWTELAPAGTLPDPRDSHSAIYDAPRDRMVVFGGYTAGGVVNDLWSLALAGTPAWTQLAPSGGPPIQRFGHNAVFDASRNRMLIHGGYGTDGADINTDLNDTWALALSGSPKWTQLSPAGALAPIVEFGGAVYDPVRERLVRFGGMGPGADEAWALALTGTVAWAQLPAGGQPPRPRDSHSIIYDAPRGRLILFGGYTQDSYPKNDAWAFDLTTHAWSLLLPTGARPAPRSNHTAIFDAPRNRMVVFGGFDGVGDLNDVWSLSLTGTPAWTQLNPSGTDPPARDSHTAIFDPSRNRMVVFGGAVEGFGDANDGWVLTLTGGGAWSELSASSGPPPPLSNGGAIYDPPRDRMIVIGQGTWALSFAGGGTWDQLAPAGAGSPDYYSIAPIYDPVRDRLVAFDYQSEVWSLPPGGGTWSTLPTQGLVPEARFYGRGVYDAAHDQLVILGGIGPTDLNDVQALSFDAPGAGLVVNVSPPGSGSTVTDPDLGCFPPGSSVSVTAEPVTGYAFVGWSGDASGSTNPLTIVMDGDKTITANFLGYTLTTSSDPPGLPVQRSPDQATYEPGSSVQIEPVGTAEYTFTGWSGDATGNDNPLTVLMDGDKTIVAHFTGPLPSCATWSVLQPNPTPGMRALAGSIWDPVRHRMLMFGGYNGGGFLNDLLALQTTPSLAWQTLAVSGTPPSPRDGTGAVYDPVRDRLLLFGGNANGTFVSDVWSVPLGAPLAWTPLSPAGTPPQGRYAPTTIYDPIGDRLLVFGGYIGGVLKNDLWALSLSGTPTWSLLTPLGAPPPPRYGHVALYDPVRNRMLIYGGTGMLTDLWQLTLAGTPTWSKLSPLGQPPASFVPGIIYDPVGDRGILFGGYSSVSGADASTTTALELRFNPPLWINLRPQGAPPAPRDWSSTVYDPDVPRMIMMGGQTSGIPFSDTYALDLSGGLTLDVGVNDPSMGGVVVDPATLCHTPGEELTLTAVPKPGFLFQGWSGDLAGTTNPQTLVMNGDRVAFARFTPGATATLVASFDAGWTDQGLEVRWRFATPEDVMSVRLERAETPEGPWNAFESEATTRGDLTVAVDHTAAAGVSYFYRLVVNLRAGGSTIVGPVSPSAAGEVLVDGITLLAPNPTGDATRIEFSVARRAEVRVSVLDVAGRVRVELARGAYAPGRYSIAWNGRIESHRVAAGIYFVRYEVDGRATVKRLVRL